MVSFDPQFKTKLCNYTRQKQVHTYCLFNIRIKPTGTSLWEPFTVYMSLVNNFNGQTSRIEEHIKVYVSLKHTLGKNHWIDVEICHQTGSRGKPVLKWLSFNEIRPNVLYLLGLIFPSSMQDSTTQSQLKGKCIPTEGLMKSHGRVFHFLWKVHIIITFFFWECTLWHQ